MKELFECLKPEPQVKREDLKPSRVVETTIQPNFKERFRDVKRPLLVFPENINLNEWELSGILQGIRVDFPSVLDINLFSCVSFLSFEYDAKDLKMKNPRMICIGYIEETKKNRILVFTKNQ